MINLLNVIKCYSHTLTIFLWILISKYNITKLPILIIKIDKLFKFLVLHTKCMKYVGHFTNNLKIYMYIRRNIWKYATCSFLIAYHVKYIYHL